MHTEAFILDKDDELGKKTTWKCSQQYFQG